MAPNEIITMVDQLWMWVLPPCGTSPSTVITAFPQRSVREKSGKYYGARIQHLLDVFEAEEKNLSTSLQR